MSTYRTTQALVEAVLLRDYDFTEAPSLEVYIATADVLINQVLECAARKRVSIDTDTQDAMAMWLSAHLYGCSDQPYKSRHTLKAGGNFQGRTGMGFDSTKYGQTAMMIDPSGCLSNINKSARMRAFWGGRGCNQGATFLWWNGNVWCNSCGGTATESGIP